MVKGRTRKSAKRRRSQRMVSAEALNRASWAMLDQAVREAGPMMPGQLVRVIRFRDGDRS